MWSIMFSKYVQHSSLHNQLQISPQQSQPSLSFFFSFFESLALRLLPQQMALKQIALSSKDL